MLVKETYFPENDILILNDKNYLPHTNLQKNRLPHKSYQVLPWIIWISHMAFITRQKIFFRGRIEFDYVDAFAVIDILIVTFLALALLFSNKISLFVLKIIKTSGFWLLVYYLVCALSVLWSLRPVYSLYRSVEFMVFFISLVVALSYCSNFEDAEKKILLFSLISVFLQMGQNIRSEHLFTLSAWHTNAYSASAAIIFSYCVGEYLPLAKLKLHQDRERRNLLLNYGIMSLIALALGTSSSSNLAAVFGIVFILFVSREVVPLIIIILALILYYFLGVEHELPMKVFLPGKSEYGIMTFGGRTILWDYYASIILKNPIYGYGLGVAPTMGGGVWMAYSHNFFIAILLATGFLGFTIFSIFILKLGVELISSLKTKANGATGVLGAMTAGFINSLTIPIIADRWYTPSFAFISILALFILYVYPRNLRST